MSLLAHAGGTGWDEIAAAAAPFVVAAVVALGLRRVDPDRRSGRPTPEPDVSLDVAQLR